jgi:hypothetical protein
LRWIKDELTAQEMGLEGYKITYIGTMGAYFVLATDETIPENLQEYGVNLLKEKHDAYMTIFQTQTEAMYSQEKYQCIAQDEQPEGDYADGTRWLDTNSSPVVLRVYDGVSKSWITSEVKLSEEDRKNYENYQRYIDNYEKLRSVQSVLVEKEQEATYCRDGYAMSGEIVNVNNFVLGSDGYLRYNGKTLEGRLMDIAKKHFTGYDVVRVDMDQRLPLYKFRTGFDNTIDFAVYLKGTTPYISYANSEGVYQMIRDYIRDKTEMNNFFTKDQWIRLSPFIKEDEYNDSNFLLTGYESEEERIKICEELMEAAAKELKTLCQPSLSFSMTMANILALPEFEPLFDQFQLGNFVKVGIRDGYIKRSRLLEINMSFDDLADFSCTFGNLVTTKSEVDKHAELLAQAVSAGKQVAVAASEWQRAVDKSNKLEEAIENGLQDAALQIGKASGQAIEWGQNGFYCRKFRDGSTDQYEDEQIAIINNKIVFTNDNWQTSKAALGEFKVDINGDGQDESMYGLIADAVVSGFIKGSTIEGGSLKIGGEGGTFIVHPDGSVQILGPDAETPVYATKDSIDLVNQAYQYHIELEYTGSTIFTAPGQTCTITCRVFDWDNEITDKLPTDTIFKWVRTSNVNDDAWNAAHITNTNTITITNEDIEKSAQFSCQCIFDETKLS